MLPYIYVYIRTYVNGFLKPDHSNSCINDHTISGFGRNGGEKRVKYMVAIRIT